jgi:hypothetical protein
VSLNGTPIHNLRDLALALADADGPLLRFELADAKVVVLPRAESVRASPAVLAQHAIPAPMSADLVEAVAEAAAGKDKSKGKGKGGKKGAATLPPATAAAAAAAVNGKRGAASAAAAAAAREAGKDEEGEEEDEEDAVEDASSVAPPAAALRGGGVAIASTEPAVPLPPAGSLHGKRRALRR